ATVLDVLLEGSLLGVVEDITGGRQPHDDVVLGQVRGVEVRAVLGGVHRESVLLPKSLDAGNTSRDGTVSESSGLGEDESAELRVVRGRWVCLSTDTARNERQRENAGKQRSRGPG